MNLLVRIAAQIVAHPVTRMDGMQLLHCLCHLVGAARVILVLLDKLHQFHRSSIVALGEHPIDCLTHLAHRIGNGSPCKRTLVKTIRQDIHKPCGDVLVACKGDALQLIDGGGISSNPTLKGA